MAGPSSPRPNVGGAICVLRERKGLSQRSLSALSARSVSYISKVESGFLQPSFRGFAQIAVALGMTPLEVWMLVQLEVGGPITTTDVDVDELGVDVTPPAHTHVSGSRRGEGQCASGSR